MSLLASRGPLVVLPALTVGVVIIALFGPGRERGVRAARLYGGPTSATAPATFRLSLIESAKTLEAGTGSPRVSVLLRAAGREAAWSGAVPDEGSIDVELPNLAASVYEVTITEGERELARGRIALEREAWAAGARQRGGWLAPKAGGKPRILVAPARGVFAVPFADELTIMIDGEPELVRGAVVELSADGADLAASHVTTDDRGRARVTLTPLEHAITLRARAKLGDRTLETSASLPVLPGALDAFVHGTRLLVRSPVPREWAYYALVTHDARLGGGTLRLSPDDQGGSGASVTLPALPKERVWAVVSSALDLRSPASVGWPLWRGDEPASTFDVPEQLLLDGMPRAAQREAARQARVRWVVAAVCGLALLLELALIARGAERARRELSRHFVQSGVAPSDERRLLGGSLTTLSALLAVALGFTILALFSLFAER